MHGIKTIFSQLMYNVLLSKLNHWFDLKVQELYKEIESLPQTLIFLSLYQSERFTPLDCKDIRIRKFEFVATTQFLWIFFDHAFSP